LAGWRARPRAPSVQDSYSRHFQVVELVTDKPSAMLWEILIHDGFYFLNRNKYGIWHRNEKIKDGPAVKAFNYYHVTFPVSRTIRSK
jgi:hypothetical protein